MLVKIKSNLFHMYYLLLFKIKQKLHIKFKIMLKFRNREKRICKLSYTYKTRRE